MPTIQQLVRKGRQVLEDSGPGFLPSEKRRLRESLHNDT